MPILIVAAALIFASFVLFMGLSLTRKKATLYKSDLAALRSVVSFKPRLGHSFTHHEDELMGLLHTKLTQLGASIDGIHQEQQHHRICIGFASQSLQLTLIKLDKFPEEWALRIDQRFKHGTSAPHDLPEVRQFLGLIQQLLQQLPVSTVRWHKRQDWDRGQIDIWSYHPY